jgi:hypothetical protein
MAHKTNLFSLRGEADNKAFAVPDLNVQPIHQSHGLLNRLGIVSTEQRFKPYEMPVSPYEIRSVFRHCSRFFEGPGWEHQKHDLFTRAQLKIGHYENQN